MPLKRSSNCQPSTCRVVGGGLGAVGQKKMCCNLCRFRVGLQLFLFCEGLAFCLSFYCSFYVGCVIFRVAGNGLRLFGVVADFSTKVQSKNCTWTYHKTVIRSTDPPLRQNRCYLLGFFRSVLCSVKFELFFVRLFAGSLLFLSWFKRWQKAKCACKMRWQSYVVMSTISFCFVVRQVLRFNSELATFLNFRLCRNVFHFNSGA